LEKVRLQRESPGARWEQFWDGLLTLLYQVPISLRQDK